jgi:N-methylhydantoinase B
MSAGGAQGVDGWGGYAAPFCALRLPSLEMYERQYPYRYLQAEYATDTAAAGKFRGAPALHYRRRMLDPVRAIVYNQGWRNPMQGYLGGRSGAGNYFVLNQGAADELTVTDACYDVPVGRDRIIFAQSGGGGGWGDPLERDPALVLADVENGYISAACARRDYGVVLDPQGRSVDEAATRRTRKARRAAPPPPEARVA